MLNQDQRVPPLARLALRHSEQILDRNRRLLRALHRLGLLPLLARVLARDLCRNTREEVNLYTYRTPHYLLSSALDYRPGYGGDQQHVWSATLGPQAICFTTHPVLQKEGTPDYWSGSGNLPRVAQVKNVPVAMVDSTIGCGGVPRPSSV